MRQGPITSLPPKGYIPICRASLVSGTRPNFDIYARFGNKYVLFRQKNLADTGKELTELQEELRKILFIKVADRHQYAEYLEENLKSVIEAPEVDTLVKGSILLDASRNVVEDLFEKPEIGQNIKRARSLLEFTADFISQGTENVKHLMALCSYDYQTYSHSVNVGVYAVALAERLGYSRSEVRAVGLGALLHDIGKIRIDKEIINKQGPLTKEEFEVIKTHPTYSYQILTEGVLPENIAAVGHEHHEKIVGGGYPRGIAGDVMHPYSKICAIANTFDILTTNRSYRKALRSFDALKLMKHEMRGSFEASRLDEFIRLMRGK